MTEIHNKIVKLLWDFNSLRELDNISLKSLASSLQFLFNLGSVISEDKTISS